MWKMCVAEFGKGCTWSVEKNKYIDMGKWWCTCELHGVRTVGSQPAEPISSMWL